MSDNLDYVAAKWAQDAAAQRAERERKAEADKVCWRCKLQPSIYAAGMCISCQAKSNAISHAAFKQSALEERLGLREREDGIESAELDYAEFVHEETGHWPRSRGRRA